MNRWEACEKVIDVAELQRRFLIRSEEEILAEYDRAMTRLAEQNANASAEEVAADVKAAIAEVRSSQP